jgi:hypothetical protein
LWSGRTDFVYTQTIEIETIRMDSFMKQNNICTVDFLHCDTQGNDLKVLKSFGDNIHLLKSGKVECFNKSNLYKEVENDFNSVTEFLKSKGFSIDEVVCNDDFEHELNVFFSRH